MLLVWSKPIRSNVTIPTTSFLHVFFTNDIMWFVHYDVIYHPSPINSQYLKMLGSTALRDVYSFSYYLDCSDFSKTLPSRMFVIAKVTASYCHELPKLCIVYLVLTVVIGILVRSNRFVINLPQILSWRMVTMLLVSRKVVSSCKWDFISFIRFATLHLSYIALSVN